VRNGVNGGNERRSRAPYEAARRPLQRRSIPLNSKLYGARDAFAKRSDQFDDRDDVSLFVQF